MLSRGAAVEVSDLALVVMGDVASTNGSISGQCSSSSSLSPSPSPGAAVAVAVAAVVVVIVGAAWRSTEAVRLRFVQTTVPFTNSTHIHTHTHTYIHIHTHR